MPPLAFKPRSYFQTSIKKLFWNIYHKESFYSNTTNKYNTSSKSNKLTTVYNSVSTHCTTLQKAQILLTFQQ